MFTLYIIRGLPGVGKDTLGEKLCPDRCFSADQFFEIGGEYQFNPTKLGEAHKHCNKNVRESLKDGDTAVANTFTQLWEYAPYIDIAKELGCRWQLISLFDHSLDLEVLLNRNIHGVPAHSLQNMYDRYHH